MFFKFHEYLLKQNLDESSINNYISSIKLFKSKYITINKKNLLAYKEYLIEKYKPKTVNLRILGINRYLEFIGKSDLILKQIKLQQKTYLENVISNADYQYLKTSLLKDNNMMWYFVVRFLACTGARVSELIEFKVEDINLGYIDIYSKGGKIRRIYIPIILKNECLNWLSNINKSSGFLFCNHNGKQITTRGIAHQLKVFASKYNIKLDVIYPHSFRHLFAKNFLEKYNDIALLADLLGHDSIETTRIYLRKTSVEQQIIVDNVVKW